MLKLRFANKEHADVWLVEPSVLIGADAGCQVSLKRDGIQPRHVDIQIKGDQLTLVNLANDKALMLNGSPVDKQAALHIGDSISLAGMQLSVIDPKSEARPVADVQASSGWAIRPNHSALANKIYSINGDTVLGRATECDLSFSVTHLSRKHAQLSIVNGQLMVKDLGSANGTFVNGQQVQESKLQKGDELRLDTLSFTVIGPGGDADKTTVRAAVTPVISAKETPVAQPVAASAPSPGADIQEKKRVAGTTAFQKAVNASEEAKQEAKQEAVTLKANWAIVAVALLAVVAIVGYMLS